MNKKAGLTLTVLIGLAALVAGFIAGSNFATPQLGPTDPSVAIRANSCDRDSVCEANSLNTRYITTTTIKGDGDLTLTTGNNGRLILNPERKSVVVEGTLTTDYFSVTTLAGEGIAYACIDDNGKIFRSLTSCR